MPRAVKSQSCLHHWAVIMGLHVSQRQEETGTQGKPAREREVYICTRKAKKPREKDDRVACSEAALIPPHLEY